MILFYDDSVVIHDLSFLRARVGPNKADPKLGESDIDQLFERQIVDLTFPLTGGATFDEQDDFVDSYPDRNFQRDFKHSGHW